ncbi:hypothetical protein RND71_029747 [Anisodus tanguticus]|uniref:Uncharacterized protein n=1 Tax=Anisodus tanguticus TaxID=243964 RepID=A0AAE1RFT9_9SOLA|nr:hypothetical protein RND71_029747 [Anisodus tanguticus]
MDRFIHISPALLPVMSLNFNISKSHLDDFFGGPAFLVWSRMGNLHRWGGPLPQSWPDQQLILQKKILTRMHELGMTPVLPAFSGIVPAALKLVFPSAKISRLWNWCMPQNFAGNTEMYGVLDAVGSRPVEARISDNSTMASLIVLVGVGMSMEGIEQNPVVYDFMSEMAFRHSPVDVKAWIDLYSRRRYGRFLQRMQDAWYILYHTIYNCTGGAYVSNLFIAPLFFQ